MRRDFGKAMWNFFKQRVSMLDQVVLSDEFLNRFCHAIADCSPAALVSLVRDFYGVVLPPECARFAQWYRSFSTRPSARPPEYPCEFLALARNQGEIAR